MTRSNASRHGVEGAPNPTRHTLKKMPLAGVFVVILLIGGVGTYYAYQDSFQPKMQVSTVSIAQPLQSPAGGNVYDLGMVSGSGSISYTATQDGTYVLTFDNGFSDIQKSLAVTYSVAGGPSTAESFNVPGGSSQTISVNLLAGQSVTGSFTVAGGQRNDIQFSIQSNTCTEAVSFSFIVVNTGNANGFAHVAFTSDGQTSWSSQYFAQMGQQLPASGTVTINNCAAHTFNVILVSQQKA